jgi:hypothetical protein
VAAIAAQPVAELDHRSLALGQHLERAADVITLQRGAGMLERGVRGLVGDQIAEDRVLAVADRAVE